MKSIFFWLSLVYVIVASSFHDPDIGSYHFRPGYHPNTGIYFDQDVARLLALQWFCDEDTCHITSSEPIGPYVEIKQKEDRTGFCLAQFAKYYNELGQRKQSTEDPNEIQKLRLLQGLIEHAATKCMLQQVFCDVHEDEMFFSSFKE